MLIKQTIVLILTVYMWLITAYVVFNFMYVTLNKRGNIVTTLRTTTYDFCKPILKGASMILPKKFVEFGPLLAFLVLRILIYMVLKINV